MILSSCNNVDFFQSELLREYDFIHAFFTKRPSNNEPVKLQEQLNLTSKLNYLKQKYSGKVIQVNNIVTSIGNYSISWADNQTHKAYLA